MNKYSLSLLIIVPFLFATQCFALPWDSLSSDEKKLLKPYANEWSEIDNNQHIKLRNVTRLWLNMNEEEKKVLKKRLKRWKRMKADERSHVKHWFQWYQKQPVEIKSRINSRRAWFKSLSSEERKVIKEQWQLAIAKVNKIQITASK